MGDSAPSADPEKIKEWSCFQHMIDAVSRCMDAGLIRAGNAQMATIGLWAAAHGITSLMITKPTFPWPPIDEVIDHVLSTAVYGLVP